MCGFTTEGVVFPGNASDFQNPAPPRIVADVGVQVVTPGDADLEEVVFGDEHDAPSGLGVHLKLPQIFCNWDFILNQVNFMIVYIEKSQYFCINIEGVASFWQNF